MVLRLALAQKIGLGTPDHALVATALPLVDGGPRRLVHGVLGTLLRRGMPVDRRAAPSRGGRGTLARGVGRGSRRGGAPADRKAPAARPDLRRRCGSAGLRGRHGGISLAPRHVRIDSASVDRTAGLRRRPLVGAGPCRLASGAAAPGGRGGRARPLRRAGRQDHAAGRRRALRHGGRLLGKRLGRLRENLQRTHLEAEAGRSRCADVASRAASSTPILLDAPCSATGTFRRHPEVLYRARPRVIAESAELQVAAAATARRDG